MNHTAFVSANKLLIIYETSAEPWATYLQSVVSGAIPPEATRCFDIGTVSKRDDFLRLTQYACKLLVLSQGMLEGLCQVRRFFLARVLNPASRVVVLLCGVDSLKPLLDVVPLNEEQCLQISSDQDPREYLTAVTEVVGKGATSPASNANPILRKPSREKQKPSTKQQTTAHNVLPTVVLVPSRVPCGSPVEVFLLLKNESAAKVTEVVFSKDDHIVEVQPDLWSNAVLCVRAPDFPAGSVIVTVLSNGVALNKTELLYYSSLEEMSCLLSAVTDPVQFMCQALRVPSVEKLDEALSSALLRRMPSGGFQGLLEDGSPERECPGTEVPTMLHFAALYGLQRLSGVLLQCPGAPEAIRTPDRHGDTPPEIARKHGHTELHVRLNDTLKMINIRKEGKDSSKMETILTSGSASNSQKEQLVSDREEEEEEEEEDPYTAFGMGDVHDATENPQPTLVMANRPPAPTPRPECTGVTDDRISYITKVLLNKNQGKTEMYSVPAKRAQGRKDVVSSTYDTVGAPHQRVRVGSLPTEGAEGHVNLCQHIQRGSTQQDKLSQLRAAVLNSKGHDGVYDKINIVHHTPSAVANENSGNGQSEKADLYSKPLKGHRVNFFWKADKR